jgi:hypothetical protein
LEILIKSHRELNIFLNDCRILEEPEVKYHIYDFAERRFRSKKYFLRHRGVKVKVKKVEILRAQVNSELHVMRGIERCERNIDMYLNKVKK